MKIRNRISALAVLIALAGCSPSEQSSSKKPPDNPGATKEAQERSKEAPPATQPSRNIAAIPPNPDAAPAPPVPTPVPGQDLSAAPSGYGTQAKDQFVASLDQKLKDMDTKIDELAKKSETYTADTKAQADQALNTLREQRDKVKSKVEEVKQASAETWQSIKAGCEAAVNDLEKAYEQAKSKFS